MIKATVEEIQAAVVDGRVQVSLDGKTVTLDGSRVRAPGLARDLKTALFGYLAFR